MSTTGKVNRKDMNIVSHKYDTSDKFQKRVMRQYARKKVDLSTYKTRRDLAGAVVGAQLKRTRSKRPPKRLR